MHATSLLFVDVVFCPTRLPGGGATIGRLEWRWAVRRSFVSPLREAPTCITERLKLRQDRHYSIPPALPKLRTPSIRVGGGGEVKCIRVRRVSVVFFFARRRHDAHETSTTTFELKSELPTWDCLSLAMRSILALLAVQSVASLVLSPVQQFAPPACTRTTAVSSTRQPSPGSLSLALTPARRAEALLPSAFALPGLLGLPGPGLVPAPVARC